jgi:hypothetical protein
METIWKRGNEFRFHRFPRIVKKMREIFFGIFIMETVWKRFEDKV